MKKAACVVISTTVATAPQARALADALVAARLAACVQILPIRSTYRWQGKVTRAREQLLLIKTRAALSRRVVASIRRRHPYALPEILIQPVTGGLPAYLAWVAQETQPP